MTKVWTSFSSQADDLLYSPGLFWRTVDAVVDSVIELPRSCGSKASLNHHPSTTMLDSWYEVIVLMCCTWFSPNMELSIMARRLHFVLVCPENIVPEVLYVCSETTWQTLTILPCFSKRTTFFWRLYQKVILFFLFPEVLP